MREIPWNEPTAVSKPYSLHLVLGEPLLRAVVELGRARAFVCRHLLRVLKRAAVGEVGCDPGGAKRVTSNFCRDAGHGRAAADHPPGVRLAHRVFGEHGSVVPARGAE